MTDFMSKHRESYVEDYFRGGGDWFNGYAPGGDSLDDWRPAFARYLTQHLTTRTGASLPKQRTYRQPTLWLGKEHQNYPVGGTLNIFGATICGLFPAATITFAPGVTKGIHVHSPDVGSSNGTSHWLDGIWAPFAGYGGGVHLQDVILQMHGATVGGIGLLIQGGAHVNNVQILDPGYHGIYVTAGVQRGSQTPETAEFPGYSNSNTVNLERIYVSHPGRYPGQSTFWVTDANPNGYRPFGCGLKIEGPDANDVSVFRFKCNGLDVNNGGAMGWAIDDNSFLGCTFRQCFSVNNERYVSQWESDIVNGTYGAPTDDELDEFDHPDSDVYGNPLATQVGVGGKVNFAFRSRTSAASEWHRFYVEGSTPDALIDIRLPSFRVQRRGSMEQATWGFENPDSANDRDSIDIAKNKHFFVIENGATGDVYNLTSRNEFIRLDHKGTNNCPFYITGDDSQASGRDLDPGKMILSNHYRSGSFAGALPGGAYPDEIGTLASLPDLSVSGTAAKYPVGSRYVVSNPAAGGASEYRCVSDGGAPNGKAWKALLLEA